MTSNTPQSGYAPVNEFFELLGGGKADAGFDGSGMSDSRLAILPGLTHYSISSSLALATTVAPFLKAPMRDGLRWHLG